MSNVPALPDASPDSATKSEAEAPTSLSSLTDSSIELEDAPVVNDNDEFTPSSPSPIFFGDETQTQSIIFRTQTSPVPPSPGPFNFTSMPSISLHITPKRSNKPAIEIPAAKRRPNINQTSSEDEEIPSTPPPPARDENETFCGAIGLLLNRASSNTQRLFARKLLLEVVSEAELGNLNRDTTIGVSPRHAFKVQDHHHKSN